MQTPHPTPELVKLKARVGGSVFCAAADVRRNAMAAFR